MLRLIVAALGMVVPLSVLDARISAYHTQLANVNLSIADRHILAGMMSDSMMQRYRILEGL